MAENETNWDQCSSHEGYSYVVTDFRQFKLTYDSNCVFHPPKC